MENKPEISLIFYENHADLFKSKVRLVQNVFTFVISGYKEIINVRKPYRFSEKKFALVTATSCLMSERRKSSTQHYKTILLFFNDNVLNEFKRRYHHLIKKNANNQHKDVLSFVYDEYCLNFRSSLETIINSKHQNNEELLKAKLNEIMLYLLYTNAESMHSLLSCNFLEKELRFKITIENNIYSNLDLEELAFLCNMSLTTFKKHFYRHYNTSPGKFFAKQRLENAKNMLEQGKKPKDIYLHAGYRTLSNFSKAYKAQFGVTPSQENKTTF